MRIEALLGGILWMVINRLKGITLDSGLVVFILFKISCLLSVALLLFSADELSTLQSYSVWHIFDKFAEIVIMELADANLKRLVQILRGSNSYENPCKRDDIDDSFSGNKWKDFIFIIILTFRGK